LNKNFNNENVRIRKKNDTTTKKCQKQGEPMAKKKAHRKKAHRKTAKKSAKRKTTKRKTARKAVSKKRRTARKKHHRHKKGMESCEGMGTGSGGVC
jgi:hypothetical protein